MIKISGRENVNKTASIEYHFIILSNWLEKGAVCLTRRVEVKLSINTLRPRPHVSGPFLNPQLFLSGYGFHPHVSGESGIRIRNFLNPLSRVQIFEYGMNPELRRRQILIFFYPVT